MIKRTLFVGAIVVGMLSLASMAVAAPPAMTLSSWEATSADGVITGGTRTVTVTNVLDEPIENLAVALDPTPCDCDIVSASTDGGTIDGFSWNVGTLNPGETKSLTLGYDTATTSSGTAWVPEPKPIGILLLTTLALAATTATLRDRDALAGVSFSG